MSTCQIEGHTLAYDTAGDPAAPPVILLHGWMSYRGVWRGTAAALQDRYFCVAVDLLGFGDSDKVKGADYGILAQGRRVLALADALGFERFTLIGHSMGGQIALGTAARLAPDRITRLVSVAGVVTGRLSPLVTWLHSPSIRFSEVCPPWFDLLRWLSGYRWNRHISFRPWFYQMDCLPYDMWAEDRRRAFQPGAAVASGPAGRAIHTCDLTPHLSGITAPTLVIFGRQDGTVPVRDGRLVAEHVPGARLVLIDACGHFPMYEQPDAYTMALDDFL